MSEIRVDIYYGHYGCAIRCCHCHNNLEELASGTLEHPRKKGWLWTTPILCEFAGKQFENPHCNVRLRRVE